MRKSFAYFFLAVILLNIAGYYLVFEGWKWHNEMSWSLDKTTYSGQELILEIPLQVPYATQERDWESSSGNFEYKGESYRIIKQKISLDAVFIACVKDNEGSRINDQLEDFVKTFTDKPVDGKQDVKAFSGFIKEYVSHVIGINHSVTGWVLSIAQPEATRDLVPSYAPSIVHPPERLS
jgi:hypothetical protein